MSPPPLSMKCSCGHDFTPAELEAATPKVFSNGRPGWTGHCSVCGQLVGQWDLSLLLPAASAKTDREDVSAVVTALRGRYLFKTREIAQYCGDVAQQSLRRWQRGGTAPKEVAHNLKRLLRIAEVLETNSEVLPGFARSWLMCRAQALGDQRPGALLPHKYNTVLQYATAYRQERDRQ